MLADWIIETDETTFDTLYCSNGSRQPENFSDIFGPLREKILVRFTYESTWLKMTGREGYPSSSPWHLVT
jgi:hypothetical protein